MTSAPVKGGSIPQALESPRVTRCSHFTPGLTAACTPPLTQTVPRPPHHPPCSVPVTIGLSRAAQLSPDA